MDKIENLIVSHYINDYYPPISMIIINFSVGVILGPTSLGLITYLIFVLFYESMIMITSRGKGYMVNPFYRCGYICAGLTGWIIGRYITNRNDGDPLIDQNFSFIEGERQTGLVKI